ncbi:BrnA antitoxin family protein [Calothrix sp. PCC 6303]|uniref:BrnA antitoxin family protein n=1 Tax=Calothrix sp. PCC 6303 TaxID=1170562 RepID=UPI0002FDDBFE|nr:BrnA antitoxin family protein [Calothrix sp. PCC 6303]
MIAHGFAPNDCVIYFSGTLICSITGSAIADQFGITPRKRGRPAKDEEDKYEPISLRFHPKIITWGKEEAEKRGIGYQTVINEALLEKIG